MNTNCLPYTNVYTTHFSATSHGANTSCRAYKTYHPCDIYQVRISNYFLTRIHVYLCCSLGVLRWSVHLLVCCIKCTTAPIHIRLCMCGVQPPLNGLCIHLCARLCRYIKYVSPGRHYILMCPPYGSPYGQRVLEKLWYEHKVLFIYSCTHLSLFSTFPQWELLLSCM